MKYNNSQSKAIRHVDGPMLVLAGPGSGKTAVITKRIENLINVTEVDPASILVITFTRAAAAEMQDRFLRLMGRKTGVTFGTFHSVFFSILKTSYGFTGANIVTAGQKVQFLREILSRYPLESQDVNELIGQILSEISYIKNSGLDPDTYVSSACGEEIFRKIYRDYAACLKRSRLLDYDDMLVDTWKLFREHREILAAWQQRYSYILVDEFQDINRIQYEVLVMLAAASRNLFVVGDDDQSIYGFRGSRPEIMRRFREDYPEAEQVLLSINYRCSSYITETALNLISHNKDRFPKQIQACRQSSQPVLFVTMDNRRTEGLFILREIQKRMQEGAGLSDFAVLYRTNSQPGLLIQQMLEYNIPFRVKENVPNLYEHWIASDMFTYLRLAAGSRAREDFLQIMNRPKRYLSRDSLDQPRVNFGHWKENYRNQPWMAERIDKLEQELRMIRGMSPYAAINYIRKGIGYDAFLQEYAKERNLDAGDLIDILDDVQAGAKGKHTLEEWQEAIRVYTAKLKTMAAAREQTTNAVTLATLHGAKGLEFDTVFLLDVNEGVVPYRKAQLEKEIEEERRLFYVGMTRAKERLYLCTVKNLRNQAGEPSRFVREAKRGRDFRTH